MVIERLPGLAERASYIEVFYLGVSFVRADKLNNNAYYEYALKPGVDRNLAILKILASLEGYYLDRKLDVQLDPGVALDRVGIIIRFLS